MSKNRRSQGNQMDPQIKAGLQAASMAQLESQRQQAMINEKEERMNLMVRMFVAETARNLYVESIAGYQEEITDDVLITLAEGSQHAAMILGDTLGLINLNREPAPAAAADGDDPSSQEETTTEGGIIVE